MKPQMWERRAWEESEVSASTECLIFTMLIVAETRDPLHLQSSPAVTACVTTHIHVYPVPFYCYLFKPLEICRSNYIWLPHILSK